MRQLHPRAVWLFFYDSFLKVIFNLSFLAVVVLVGFPVNISNLPLFFFLVLIGFIILSWVIAKLTYSFYKYELREDGFRKEHGIIWKKYVTIPYDRIQNVDIYRGVIARLLGLSDLQIQTAGGITAGSYGGFSEGRLRGLSMEDAEKMRDELIARARQSRNQGL
jgi:uncharacterized membrane protein YdbT with pleckstrin-like domain